MTSVVVPQAQLEGSVIAGKYRLERLLGEGGMGAVWRAFHLQLEVPVALKLLRASPNAAELRERMHVEGRAVAKLVHPSIVRVFDIGEAEWGEPFIVMELLNGESLGAMLERGALTQVRTVQLLLPIAEALWLAHSRGVVHRDLKPDNIVIASEGTLLQPKLLDFGIAKMQSALVTGAPTLTQDGMLLGSPDYMSPEQAYGRLDIDERSDIWAFCVVLYEALSGQTPFRGEGYQQVLRDVVAKEAVPLAELSDVDPVLSDLVQSGLAKDREARPASIFELGCQLAGWLQAQGVNEDATGSSLAAKWQPKPTGAGQSSGPREWAKSTFDYEQATLVSVVHGLPRPGREDVEFTVPLRRRRRWLPSAFLLAGVLLGCAIWAFRPPNELVATGAASATSPPNAAPALAFPAAPSPADSVARGSEEAVPVVAVESSRPRRAQREQTGSAAAITSSLPRALPPRDASDASDELLNPY